MAMNTVAFNVEMEKQAAVGIPLGGTSRILQLNSGWGLTQLAEMIRDKAAGEKPWIMSEKGIPDGGGHVSYIKQQVANPDKPGADKTALDAWIGTLILIGLSFRRGYLLDIRREDLSQSDMYLVKGYSKCLAGAGTTTENHPELYFICKNGRPIAVLDKDILFCPFTYVEPAAMKDVPWYHPENTDAHIVAWWDDLTESAQISNDERRCLLYWLENLCPRNGGPLNVGRAKAILEKAKMVISGNGRIVSPEKYPLYLTDFAKTLKDFTFGQALFNLPGYAVEMPLDRDVFSDVLLLVPGARFTPCNSDKKNPLERALTIRVPAQDKEFGYGVMLPLRESFTKFLQKNDNRYGPQGEGHIVVKVESLTLTPRGFDAPPSQIDKATIAVDMNVRVGSDSIRKYHWVYKANDTIYCVEEFYNLHLWPNYRRIDPATGEDAWKNYLVTLSTQRFMGLFERTANNDSGPEDVEGMIMLKPDERNICLWHEGRVLETLQCEQKIYQPEAGMKQKQTWYHAQYSSYPEFISFAVKGKNGGLVEAGCLHPVAQQIDTGALNKEAEFAIDFGTSATMCMAGLDGGAIRPVPLHTYSDLCSLVSYCTDLGESSEAPELTWKEDVSQFEDYHWLGTELLQDGYARTVAQIASCPMAANKVLPPASGRIFPGKEENLAYFLTQSDNMAQQNRYKNVSLAECGLHANIKLSSMDDPRNRQAALHYLLHVGEQCLLYALKEGCGKVRFLLSYPDKLCKDNLQQVWHEMTKKLHDMSIISGLDKSSFDFVDYEECVAASCYINSRVGTPSGEVGYAIIDIGGGTMDISLWRVKEGKIIPTTETLENNPIDMLRPTNDPAENPTENAAIHLLAKGSVRYAGNRVLAESLYLTQRHFGDAFEDLWDDRNRTESFKALINKLKEIAPVRSNDSAAEIMEHLATKALIVNTLMSETGFASENWGDGGLAQGTPEAFLRVLINTKLFAVFYILGSYAKAASAVNLQAMNNGLSSYEIRLAGGGARIINLCSKEFSDMLPRIVGLRCVGDKLVKTPDGKEEPAIKRFLAVPPQDKQKVEVVQGMLQGGKSGNRMHREERALEPIKTTAKFNSDGWSKKIYMAYEDLARYYRDVGLFGYRLPGDATQHIIYDLVAPDRVDKNLLNGYMQNNFIAMQKAGVPEAVIADVVAVLTMDDILSHRLS